jgi:hypothetical protein
MAESSWSRAAHTIDSRSFQLSEITAAAKTLVGPLLGPRPLP